MIARVLFLVLLGCAAVAGAGSTPDPSVLAYRRATNVFAIAHFIKPVEPPSPDIAFQLAPLLIQEALGDEPLKDAFGTLSLSNGIVTLDRSRPTVYFQIDQVELGAKVHQRFTYLWCYSVDNLVRGQRGLAIQGVRITADTAGSPVIWEVLADESGLDLVFVAESLESAARLQWGKVQSGRNFAIEQVRRKAPRTAVARVIVDGPVPMGPIVYLQSDTRNVNAVVCRCMPAQAKSLLTSSVYQLRPIQEDNADLLLQMLRDRLRLRAAFWPGEKDVAGLQKKLRLPKSF